MQAAASIGLLLMSVSTQPGFSQQQQPTPPAASSSVPANVPTGITGLPTEPEPKFTDPLYLRDTPVDYTKPKPALWKVWKPYTPIDVPLPQVTNSVRIDSLMRNGTIYLSLSDAIALTLENNYDIAIARINLDIADTDILRAKAGAGLRGVSSGLVANTLGGSGTTVTGGGGPGGTSTGSGGGGAGLGGIVVSTNGGGPVPETLDPLVTSTLQYEAAQTGQSSTILTGTNALNQNTATYNFGYQQGFLTGTLFNFSFNNSHTSTNSQRTNYSPLLTSTFRATATQHLLQGFGPWLNGRFIIQAKNDRRITDSSFRQQLLFTVTQVESIYWGLVSAYEDEQAKERALTQSTQLAADDRKQLEQTLSLG